MRLCAAKGASESYHRVGSVYQATGADLYLKELHLNQLRLRGKQVLLGDFPELVALDCNLKLTLRCLRTRDGLDVSLCVMVHRFKSVGDVFECTQDRATILS